jgi:type II secretory pathway component GspD/PulD (secretin)
MKGRHLMMWHPNSKRVVLLAAAVSALFLLGLGTANGEPLPNVSYSKGCLTVKAAKVPLFTLLESISDAADVEFYISEGVEPCEVTVEIAQEPLDRALKRVLDAFNHTVTYEGSGGAMRVAKVHVYSKGESSVPSTAQATKDTTSQKTAAKGSGAVPSSEPGREATAIKNIKAQESPGLSPSTGQTSGGGQRLSEVMTKRFDMEEIKAFNEITALKNQIRATEDPENRVALNLALANKLSAFEAQQQINQSKIEALYRIELFHEMKNNPEKGVKAP